MARSIRCIECPKGCLLAVEADGRRFISVSGNECPKGEKYAAQEVEDPRRILTSTVRAIGLDLKMVPVKTDKPMPKKDILKGAERIRELIIKEPLKAGDVVAEKFLGYDIDLIATRDCAAI
jgi:CxxC motif-containing protein